MNPNANRQTNWIVDTTFRDGEQAAGVVLDPRCRLRIARRIAETGVQEMEIGTPAMGEDACRQIRSLASLHLSSRLTAWCRAREDDIELAALCGVQGVHVSLPVSASHRGLQNWSEDDVLNRVQFIVRQARKYFDFVSVGAQDGSRTPVEFLIACMQAARDAGAHRFRLADTVGILTPVSTWQLVQKLSQAVPEIALGLHAHNDLGMATANSVTALQAGATSVDVTVNGIGERAGNAALEEVLAALRMQMPVADDDVNFPFNLKGLRNLSRLVEQASGRLLPASKPVVGNAAFWHESGIHVRGVLTKPETYEPFDPASVGADGRSIILGSHSGAAAIQHVLSSLGCTVNKQEASALLPAIRRMHRKSKKPITHAQLLHLWKQWRSTHSSASGEY